jgi:hypothetical protein
MPRKTLNSPRTISSMAHAWAASNVRRPGFPVPTDYTAVPLLDASARPATDPDRLDLVQAGACP